MAPLLTLEAPTITLRDYQEEAIARVLHAWTLPSRRALVVFPTGAGKTIIFASLLKRLNEPALILAHREELLTQAREKILWQPGARRAGTPDHYCQRAVPHQAAALALSCR
jgi:superfamily II DNA or RNA helicase